MTSPTDKTNRVRKRKQTTRGKKRKAVLRNKGTTKSPAVLFGDVEGDSEASS